MSSAANGEADAASNAVWKDKDPPPSFEGDVDSFKGYLRDLKIWRHETDVPARKHAAKMLRCLSGPAKAICDEIEVDQLLTEGGADLIVTKLKEYFQPHLESSMPKAFERAVYGEARKGKEGFGEFILRQDASFRSLAEEGVKLDDQVKGYIMFRQGNLSQTQEDQVTTWTQGKYDRADVVKAFRKLDKVQREKSSKHFATYEEDEGISEEGDDEEDSEEYVYLGESDLQQVYEESELQEALATYQQVRKAIKEQKTGRGYYGPKSQSSSTGSSALKGGGGFKGKGGPIRFGGKGGGGARVHVDLLKLRTKCAKCGQIGHWAKECVNEPDARGKKSASGDGGGPKSGFFEVHEQDGSHFQVTLGQCMKIYEVSNKTQNFKSHHDYEVGIVDTAAQGGLVGRERLRELEQALSRHGLKIKWLDKKAQARGIGGEASVCGVAEIPVGIAGVNGLIEVTVVEDRVPFLLSIKFLREVQAVVDLVQHEMKLTRFGKSCPLRNLETGHIGVNVLHFAPGGWSFPHSAPGRGEDFHFWTTAVSSSLTFMSQSSKPIKGSSRRHVRPFQHCSANGGRRAQFRAQGHQSLSWMGRKGYSKLESLDGARDRRDGVCKGSGKAQCMARRWICTWLAVVIAATYGTPEIGSFLPRRQPIPRSPDEGTSVRGTDPHWNEAGAPQESESTQGLGFSMRASSSSVEWCWESKPERSVVHRVPSEVACGSRCDESGTSQTACHPHQRQDIPVSSQAPNSSTSQEREIQCFRASTDPREVLENPGTHDTQEHSCQLSSGHTHRSSTPEDGDPDSPLQLRSAGHPIDRQEGGTHTGSTLLEVHSQSVQLLRMGSGGGQTASEEGIAGEGRCRATEDGAGGGSGEGRSHPNDDPSSRAEASRGDARGESTSSAGVGADEEPDVLALSGGRGREDGGSVQQPPTAAADDDESHRVEEPDDRRRDEGRTSRSRNEQWQLKQGDALPDTQMRSWMREHAPRVCELSTEAQRNVWAKKQLEEQDLPAQQRQVLDGFWTQAQPEGGWYFHHGVLPSFGMEEMNQVLGVFAEEGAWAEEFYEEGRERALSKSSKKGVLKGMKQLVVAEVFSPPRVSAEAEKMGHRSGGAFDLETGYDLRKSKDRRKAMQHLRQEDPDLVIICPPCGPFSALQHLNVAQHGYKTLQFKLAEGREYLKFGMRIYEWQARRGKSAVFEHPALSAAWDEDEVLRVLRLPNVVRVRADQREYGLAVHGIKNKKPTDFMVTGHGLAKALSKRCSKQHEHQPLIGGIAKLAQKYPQALCRAMIRGAEEDANCPKEVWAVEDGAALEDSRDIEDLLDEAIDREGSEARRIRDVRSSQDGKALEEPHDEEDVESGGRELTRSDKQLIHKLHCNLGHPSNLEFAKALRMARARGVVWKYVKDEFTCSSCERNVRPKPARPAMLPKSFEPCKTLGIDVVYFPGLDARKAVPVLNMTDLATGYQMLEPLDGVTSNQVWEKFYGSWARVFSLPEVILVDQGREFYKDFATKVSEAGVLLKVIGARAPWQQGRTERHGGLAKDVFTKIREDVIPTTWAEWKLCIYAVEAAKNRMYNRSGFSPAQRQLGYNLRLPGSLGSDDVYDPAMMVQSTSGDMQRLLEIRHAAMQAFIKHTTNVSQPFRGKAPRFRCWLNT
eukprot:s1995_g2.t1